MRGAWRIVLAGCLAELATVVVIVLTITVHQRLTAASPAENEAYAAAVGGRIGPACGTLFVFFFAFWAASTTGIAPLWAGALSGAVAAALTVPALLAAPGPVRRVYALSIVLKIVAGLAAGALAERRRARA